MPRTMLTDQHWQKLKVILRNYPFTTTQIYAILLKLFSIELEQAVRGEIFLAVLVIQTLFSNVLIVGQAAVSFLDYSNY
ncbi:iS5 family transposase OrfA [Acinetobacter baumannii 1295743]|uniref:IS5 family transposase OrfA n=1 Tax=Acinetobacter baumannii (strain 1295743) TaxID=1310613 RepID=A0A009HTW3_ACIB9|nr:iS5 family transposase OrfA [Acinetobacter baumannii 1295743]